jgi:hypothetical protein
MNGQSILLRHLCVHCTAYLSVGITKSDVLYAKCDETGVLIMNGGGVKKCPSMVRAE